MSRAGARRRSRRRGLGRALLVFGGAGLALLVGSAAIVLVSFGAIADATTGLERQRVQLVAMLEPAATSLRDAARASEHAGASLQSSAAAARDGAILTNQLAASLDQMAALANLNVLGARPFAAAGASFTDTATRSRSLAASLDTTAVSLDADIADTVAVASDLARLAAQLDSLRADLSSGTPAASTASPTAVAIGLARFVLLGLLAWLAVPAIACLWLGWRLSRRAEPRG